MSARVVAVGSAASFVVAAVAGVLGNQVAADAVWAWVAFGVALVVGAGVTAVVAYRTTAPGQGPAQSGSVTHAGDDGIGCVTAEDGQAIGVNYGIVTQNHNTGCDSR